MSPDSIQDHSEASQDCDSQPERNTRPPSGSINATTSSVTPTATTSANSNTGAASSGYYDADKCRAYIANQIKVSKIDRFASQVSNAIDVESNIQQRLSNVLNMYVKRCAQITHEFTFKCKTGLQRHRLLVNQRKPSKIKKTDRYLGDSTKQVSLSNDLLHGSGVQMVRALLTQPTLLTTNKHVKKKITTSEVYDCGDDDMVDLKNSSQEASRLEGLTFNENDYLLCDAFEPALFVKKLDDCIRNNLRKSKAIMVQLSTIRQLFERLASEHRDNVDLVYAAEEERQAATVVRRSAYNLSVAAIKATSTPVHVNFNTNE